MINPRRIPELVFQQPEQTRNLLVALAFSFGIHALLLIAPTGMSAKDGTPLFTLPAPKLAATPASLQVKLGTIKPPPPPSTSAKPMSEAKNSGVLIDQVPINQTAPHHGPIDLFADYLKPSQLSAPPAVLTLGSLNGKAPDTRGVAGKVLLEILINERGQAVAVTPIEFTVPEIYRDYVIGVLMEARYSPGELFGNPAKSRIKIEIEINDGKLIN